jgi:hypothetical protein
MPADRLVTRLTGAGSKRLSQLQRTRLGVLMKPIFQDNEMVGRLALWPEGDPSQREDCMSALVIGGLRVLAWDGAAGILLGDEPNVARNKWTADRPHDRA